MKSKQASQRLTPDDVRRYVARGGRGCPHCGSLRLIEGEMTFERGAQRLVVRCDACRRRWQDCYELCAIEEA